MDSGMGDWCGFSCADAHREQRASLDSREILSGAAGPRLAILEGQWLGEGRGHTLVGHGAASVLEGSEEAFRELAPWIAWHARRYPEGAAIGFLAYELARFFEPLPLAKFDTLPDVSFTYFRRIEKAPCATPGPPVAFDTCPPTVHGNFDEASYNKAVRKIYEYLTSGDIYQANLTQQFTAEIGNLTPERIYLRLAGGGAPFRAFLRSPGRAVVSNSPERFFRVSGRNIMASPIKGTVGRGGDDATDERQFSRLLASTKDRAENVMIVDLVRNDLGRICEYKSVQAQLFEVLALPHLFHLVSHVRGTLRPEVGLTEIIRALFPCGSVTGAPKIRAMEILGEIERVPRGVSMGAVGIILNLPGTEECEMDFNVAIRTLTFQDDIAVFNVGGGIVYDSKPRAEYEELMLKARPLLEALGVAGSFEPQAHLACAPTS